MTMTQRASLERPFLLALRTSPPPPLLRTTPGVPLPSFTHSREAGAGRAPSGPCNLTIGGPLHGTRGPRPLVFGLPAAAHTPAPAGAPPSGPLPLPRAPRRPQGRSRGGGLQRQSGGGAGRYGGARR